MKLPGRSLFRERGAVSAFERQEPAFRELVFYSEGASDWPHLGPIVTSLLGSHNVRVSYLTSDDADPGLRLVHPRLRAFSIGSGTARTILFARMDCRYFVMTLPDLGRLWLKRSPRAVHYVYAFHSMNSTHTSYREGAFDNYDTILCVGPHHLEEIRRTERVYGLREKRLIEHGSVKLDSVLAEVERYQGGQPDTGPRRILLAPTWGPDSILEHPIGHSVIAALLGGGYRTVVRPHPMTSRRRPDIIADLRRTFEGRGLFELETDMNAVESWMKSSVMISDWSGAAIEYAFATERPVVYIDTPPKIMNTAWARIDVSPFEERMRTELGHVVRLNEIAALPSIIDDLIGRVDQRRAAHARERSVFNLRHSASVAASHLAALAAGESA